MIRNKRKMSVRQVILNKVKAIGCNFEGRYWPELS